VRALIALTLAAWVGLSPAPGLALTESEVAEALICYACPGEPLTADRCSGGDQMRAAIRRMIAEGKTKQEILDYFVAQFGEEILTVPPKRGFNLVAYVGPFVGFAAGAVVAVVVIRRWGRAAPTGRSAGPAGPPPVDEAARSKVEDELARLEDEEV